MKYMKECAIILGITLVGEGLNLLLPLPVPAGVYGLFLMLLLLYLGILKPEQVEATGNFLLDIMPLLFVPAAVGLMDSFEQLRPLLVPVVSTCVISTLVVMAVTGKTAEAIIQRGERNRGEKGIRKETEKRIRKENEKEIERSEKRREKP